MTSQYHTATDKASNSLADDSSSEESYVNSCSPCGHRGSQRQATLYCLHCKELLCQVCKDYHESFKQFRDHKFSPVASDRKVLLDSKVVNTSTASVRLTSDKHNPQITGIVLLPNGNVVLCDRANQSIKVLDVSGKITDSLDFPGQLRDAALVDNNTIVVAFPEHKCLQFVHFEGKPRVGSAVLLQKMPLAVDFVNGEIFASCKTRSKAGTGEIDVFDRTGNLKRKLGINIDGSCMFDCPSHITVSRRTNNIYISDRDTSMVTCLSSSGDVIYQVTSPDLVRARGIYVDAVDNLFVCGETSTNVLKLSNTGEYAGTLLNGVQIARQPCALAYREKDGVLLVGCYNSRFVHIITLQ